MTAPTDYPATIAEALARLQAELPHVKKNETADIPGKEGRRGYSYDYADLADVSHAVLPLMGELGLSYSCKLTTRKGVFGLRYVFRLAGSAETDKGWIVLRENTPQQVGSAFTYFRRYILNGWTGVAPEGDDDDGQAAGDAPAERGDRGGAWMNRRPDVPPKDLQDKLVRGPRPGPELEQLRDGTVEPSPQDRPAKRTRSQAPEGDPWLDEPPGVYDERPPEELPGSMTEPQRRRLFQAFAELGISRPSEQRDVLSDITKRPISSRKDLSLVEMDATVLPDLDARIEAKQAAEAAMAAAAGQDAAEVDAP